MADLSDDIVDVEMEVESPWNMPTKQCRDKWLEKMCLGVLSITHFKEHWRIWVPRIYSPSQNESCLDWSYDEEKARKILFSTLEEFICNGEPGKVLANLSQLDRPPSVCGRVFKVGEPTYSCRECGMDSTCVLCVDCFKRSEHRSHKYKMGTSNGGGCCDCGDPEAWKKAPFCDVHIAGTAAYSTESRPGLPEDMSERVKLAFEAVLCYAYELLSMEHSPRIPADLCLKDQEDSLSDGYRDLDNYCTVLYNDETHTFEQVINTLTRVIKCNQKVAIEYVTNIDREGRAVVKCSSFQHCSELKTDIQKYTSRHGNKPLKVLVVHAHVVAHQLYAMKLLSWLQAFLAHGEEFRACFTEVALKSKLTDVSIVEGILLRDIHMWKSARTHWHRLLISGMLMEYDSKKALARVFTKKYGMVMKDFIRDDHDHSFSVSSLSVQIFTVPTLAHYLIAEEDALFTLLNAFISECSRKCNRDGKLEFERNASGNTFKRAQFMLYDLRYLLSSVPEQWTDPLRKGFLQGLALLLNLLAMMQGMDAVARQIGQHMEYEPEWESAFNLHVKLAYCISLALEWCATDRVVLIKAYRATLKKLHEAPHPCVGARCTAEVQEVADHSVACLQYDVSTKPLSIHLPLSRFLAGLHLHLETYGLRFDSPEMNTSRPTPEEIIEPVLRTQAMIAQVHAGMWRRNGYALLNQLYFYHNVKCRSEMLDRDIVLLQMGASVIESNEFLIHVLNKFNLINWAHPDFEIIALRATEEDNMRQTISLVEEFLQLLIVIVGERHMPGVSRVTQHERIKKEIVQQLCIRALAHSELNKTLPDDVTHEMVLDDVVNEVATFKKPGQGSGKGVYELRPELHKHYNVFFYHYTREELSRSEEAQRKRRKAAGELECCPPPDLPQLSDSFSLLVNLLQCDVMLYVMQTVLERSANLRARSFSEPQLHKVLHLIGYALQEEQSRRYPILLFTERAQKWKLVELMDELCSSPRVEAHKDLLTWTLDKFKSVAGANADTRSAGDNTPSSSGSTQQHDLAQTEKERRARLAAQRREKIMAQMAAMQNNFMKENAELFEEATSEQTGDSNAVTAASSTADTGAMELSERCEVSQPVALGPRQTTRLSQERTYTCILCQEEQKVTQDGPVLVLAAFVQQATVLCQTRDRPPRPHDDHTFLDSNLGPAPHTSTCGHVMHSDCWQKYFDSVVMKEHRRPYRHRHPASFDVEKQEFLCPLCECLSNTVLPLLPPLSTLRILPAGPSAERNLLAFDDWLRAITFTVYHKREQCHGVFKCGEHGRCRCDKLAADTNADGDGSNECDVSTCNLQSHRRWLPAQLPLIEQAIGLHASDYIRLYDAQPVEFGNRLKDMIDHYAMATYTRGLSLNQNLEDKRVSLLMWKSCAYTIHTMEIVLRDANKPLLGYLSSRQRDCLESLVRIVAVFGSTWKQNASISGHAFQLLLHVIEHTDDGPSILDWDSLGLLIPLTVSLPGLYRTGSGSPPPVGDTLDQHILQLVFAAHIVKILVTTDLKSVHAAMDTDDFERQNEEQEDEAVSRVLQLLGRSTDDVSTRALWRHVQYAARPFLRCCVLFYRYLTDVPAPPALSEPGGDTFAAMCQYLGLADTCSGLLGAPSLTDLMTRWCAHPRVRECQPGRPPYDRLVEPLPINKLVELPADYSELINAVSLFTCPNSDREDSRNPTMCLVCGEMLCSQSYCCQIELNKQMVGACTYHAHRCGAGVGVFLRVRECEILFLASPMRGCFVSPPYLDAYGETDQGLRRGNPLHLCPDKYRKLQTLWLSHSIHEEIARAIESSSNFMSTQWQHL